MNAWKCLALSFIYLSLRLRHLFSAGGGRRYEDSPNGLKRARRMHRRCTAEWCSSAKRGGGRAKSSKSSERSFVLFAAAGLYASCLLLTSIQPFWILVMAFSFGFGGDDDDVADAPSQAQSNVQAAPTHQAPAKQHDLQELVGKLAWLIISIY